MTPSRHDPEHARRPAVVIEMPRPEAPGHSNSKCSMWRHLCSLCVFWMLTTALHMLMEEAGLRPVGQTKQ